MSKGPVGGVVGAGPVSRIASNIPVSGITLSNGPVADAADGAGPVSRIASNIPVSGITSSNGPVAGGTPRTAPKEPLPRGVFSGSAGGAEKGPVGEPAGSGAPRSSSGSGREAGAGAGAGVPSAPSTSEPEAEKVIVFWSASAEAGVARRGSTRSASPDEPECRGAGACGATAWGSDEAATGRDASGCAPPAPSKPPSSDRTRVQ